jgi:hypothetical protein
MTPPHKEIIPYDDGSVSVSLVRGALVVCRVVVKLVLLQVTVLPLPVNHEPRVVENAV